MSDAEQATRHALEYIMGEVFAHRNRANEAEARIVRLTDALRNLLRRDQQNTCQHENTHRGGVIWEICDDCGLKWADDEGGKPVWQDPQEWIDARAALSIPSPVVAKEGRDA